MRARHIFFLIVLATAGVPRMQAQAPDGSPSAVIEAIHVQGSTHYKEEQVAAASGLKIGDAATRDDIQNAANTLARLGVFGNINFTFSTAGDKLTLNFIVSDAPRMPVEFDNFPWFTDRQIESAIRELAPLFDGTAPTDGAELQAMDSAITRLLAARNLAGEVEHRLVAQPAVNDFEMQFRVNGPATTLDSLDLGDPLAVNSPQVRERLHDVVKQAYSRFSLEVFEEEQVRPLYLSSGHLRVQFGELQVKLLDPGPNAKVAAALRIDPGPAYEIAGIDWKGASVLSESELANLSAFRASDLADGLKLAAMWQRVTDEYLHRGYLDAKLIPNPQYDDAAGKVTFHATITEGLQYHMGDLVLTGLSLGAEEKLKAAWKLPKGQPFDRTYYDMMMEKLSKPSEEVFKDLPVHYTTLGQFLRIDPNTHIADVLLDFK